MDWLTHLLLRVGLKPRVRYKVTLPNEPSTSARDQHLVEKADSAVQSAALLPPGPNARSRAEADVRPGLTRAAIPQPDVPVWDDADLTASLDLLSSLPRCVTSDDLAICLDPEIGWTDLEAALAKDPRFIRLPNDTGDSYYITVGALFHWLVSLNLRLARAKTFVLGANQVGALMSSLLVNERWRTPPVEMIAYGEHRGLIGEATFQRQYCFPLAYLISQFRVKTTTKGWGTVAEFISSALGDIDTDPSAANESLEECIEEELRNMDSRVVYVIQRRLGLPRFKRETLGNIGIGLGITRERVRQIEAKFYEGCAKRPALIKRWLAGLVREVMGRHGSLLVQPDSLGAGYLLLAARCLGLPYAESDFGVVVLGASRAEMQAIDHMVRSALSPVQSNRVGWKKAGFLLRRDIETLTEAASQARRRSPSEMVYLALKALGKPAHYSKVAEECARLFPEATQSEHNIHAILWREPMGIVWIGVKGTYALKEWGFEHPSKSLFDATADIVGELFGKTGQPVLLSTIAAELGRSRPIVHPTSLVFATHFNARLRRVGKDSFVPRSAGEREEDEISLEELDATLRAFENRDRKPTSELSPDGTKET